jgi:hypothetical protein
MIRGRALRLLVLTAVACQPTSEPDRAAPTPTPVAPPPVSPPEPPAVPATPAAPGPVQFTTAALQVRLAAHIEDDGLPALHELADGRLFISDGVGKLAEVPAPRDGESRARGLVWFKLPRVTPRSYDSMFSGERLETFGGRWPDLALATVAFMAPRTGTVRGLFRRKSAGWQRQDRMADPDGFYVAIVPWTEGRALGLRIRDEFSAESPTFTPNLAVFGARDPAPNLPVGLRPQHMTTTPAGDVFVVGTRDDSLALSVARWAPTGGEPLTVQALPAFRDTPVHTAQWFITAASATEAYVGGGYAVDPGQGKWTPYLAALTGDTWTEVATPVVGRIGSLARTPDGSLWLSASEEHANNKYVEGRGDVVHAGALWRRTPDGAWVHVTLATTDGMDGRDRPYNLDRHLVREVALRGAELCMLAARNDGRSLPSYAATLVACGV